MARDDGHRASGMLRKNAQRQLANWTSQPPTNGPMAAAMPPSPDQDPMALARSSCRIVASIIDRLPGVSSAPRDALEDAGDDELTAASGRTRRTPTSRRTR